MYFQIVNKDTVVGKLVQEYGNAKYMEGCVYGIFLGMTTSVLVFVLCYALSGKTKR